VLLQGCQADLLPRSNYRLHLGSQQPLAGEGKKQPRGVTGAPVPAAGRNPKPRACRSSRRLGAPQSGG